MRRWAVVVCVLAASACGVSAQDEPQIIKESTQPPSTATPSFETETEPPFGSPATTTTIPASSSTPAG
ncbi:MAG: hypothetical protein WBA97_12240 [Actinophytocola sp.]|uniref:hypothetical protein n=1 Tax=Actinophytocola sp. TaxID=1872138 RepID=UPI003C788451